MNAIAIGQTIRKLREEQGFTQATLGKTIKVSEQYISALERGVRKPGATLIVKLCAALGVTEEQILFVQQSDAHRLLYNLAGECGGVSGDDAGVGWTNGQMDNTARYCI